MTEYVVTRIAQNNPDIDGRKLYMTRIGLWSLDSKHARKFLSRNEAEQYATTSLMVERAS